MNAKRSINPDQIPLVDLSSTPVSISIANTVSNSIISSSVWQSSNSSMIITNPTVETDDDDSLCPHGLCPLGYAGDYLEILLFALFLVAVGLAKIAYHKIKWLSASVPESCLLIVIGILLGLIFNFVPHIKVTMDNWTFTMFILTPIILEASYSLHGRVFFENMFEILVYAIFGTLFAFIIIGIGLSLVCYLVYKDPTVLHSLLFSSFIVAVDPVAILAIFQDLGVDKCLYFMVFGESLLNDGVAMVLYEVLIAFNDLSTIHWWHYLLGIGKFFTVALGGALFGLLGGAISSFVLKYTRHVAVIEPFLVFMIAYLSYVLALFCTWSGIISLIVCGLVQAQYAFHNMHEKSSTTVKYFAKTAANLCEALIFMALGIALVNPFAALVFPPTGSSSNSISIPIQHYGPHYAFYLSALFLCIFSRFVVTYALTFVLNLWRLRKITFTEQFIMAYGGLRGAIAFSLAMIIDLELHTFKGNTPDENTNWRGLFVFTTLIIIVFTSFLQGILTKPFIKLLRIRLEESKPLSLLGEVNSRVMDNLLAGMEGVLGRTGPNFLRELLITIDELFIHRLLLKDPDAVQDKITGAYQTISLQMHYALLNQDSKAFEKAIRKLPKGLLERTMSNNPGSMSDAVLFRSSSYHQLEHAFDQKSTLQREEAYIQLGSTGSLLATGPTQNTARKTKSGASQNSDENEAIGTAGGRGGVRQSDGSVQVRMESEMVEEQAVIAGMADMLQLPVSKLSLYEMPSEAELELEDARYLRQLKKKRYFLYLLEKARQRREREQQEQREKRQRQRESSMVPVEYGTISRTQSVVGGGTLPRTQGVVGGGTLSRPQGIDGGGVGACGTIDRRKKRLVGMLHGPSAASQYGSNQHLDQIASGGVGIGVNAGAGAGVGADEDTYASLSRQSRVSNDDPGLNTLPRKAVRHSLEVDAPAKALGDQMGEQRTNQGPRLLLTVPRPRFGEVTLPRAVPFSPVAEESISFTFKEEPKHTNRESRNYSEDEGGITILVPQIPRMTNSNYEMQSVAVDMPTGVEDEEPVVRREKPGRQRRKTNLSLTVPSGESSEGLKTTEAVVQVEDQPRRGHLAAEPSGGEGRERRHGPSAPDSAPPGQAPRKRAGPMRIDSGLASDYRSTNDRLGDGSDTYEDVGGDRGLSGVSRLASDVSELSAVGGGGGGSRVRGGPLKHLTDAGPKKRTAAGQSQRETLGRDNPAATIHEEKL